MVQDVVIAIYMGVSKQVFVYRQITVPAIRSVEEHSPVVGGSVKCSISHPHLLVFMATLLYNRENKANSRHFLLNEYQVCPQYQAKVVLSASSFWGS